MIFLRSLIFFLVKALMTIPFSLITLMTFPFPAMMRYRVISQWSGIVNWLARDCRRHHLAGRGFGKFAVRSGGHPVQTPVGLGNHRVSADIPAVVVRAEEKPALHPVFRLGPGAVQPDCDRSRRWHGKH
jgi:hypothetical protein